MKKNILFLLVMLSLVSQLDAAKKSEVPPHPQGKTEEDVVLIKDEMQVMKKNFQAMEGEMNKDTPDYAVLEQSLNRLEGASKLIIKMNVDPQFEKSFKKFQKDLGVLKGEVEAKNRSGIDAGMSDLFQNCFGCHLTHVVHQKKVKEGL